MADCGVLISSVSLSGLTTEVTFFPQTGGTVDLGNQVFPFSYVANYYYGTYNCYVPTYAYTYSIVVLAPTPTVTPTNTTTPTQTSSVTPTNTETPTQTPTNTETPTQTPTNTETPTQTPTQTETPTQTQTPTNTETPTQTPTNTETSTPTPTQTPTNTETSTPTPTETSTQTPTPTNTQTPTPTNLRIAFSVVTGTTTYEACNSLVSTTIYGDNATFDNNSILYNTMLGPSTIDMSGYYNYSGQLVQLDSNGNEIGGYTLCSILPTQTNTPSHTPTPTTIINYYYDSLPSCSTINPLVNVVLDNEFCLATTITSDTVLSDGTYWIYDGLTGRRDIIASSGTYTFNGVCVGCA